MTAAELPVWWENILAHAVARIQKEGEPVPLSDEGVRAEARKLGPKDVGGVAVELLLDAGSNDSQIVGIGNLTFSHDRVASNHGIVPSPAKDSRQAIQETLARELTEHFKEMDGWSRPPFALPYIDPDLIRELEDLPEILTPFYGNDEGF